MADNNSNPGVVTNTFNKGMVKDYNETFVGDGLWTHARNAVNNSHDGQVGVLGNEPSNLYCLQLPYTLIGCIHLADDRWAIFTTDDVHSEIGIFDESACSYQKVINDDCLNFKRSNLITGVSRKRYDCERLVYWDDGLNPSRVMDLDNPPMQYTESIVDSCVIKKYSNRLDCEKIRLAPLFDQPCLELSKGKGGGTLANGSYQVCMAYAVNGTKVTDYIGLSNVQSLFAHENINGSLDVTIKAIDKDYDEFELVIISTVNMQTVAKRLGFYSTGSTVIHVDNISAELISIPIAHIPLRTEPIEKSDAMYNVNNYLLRVGTYSKYQFNYQKQANKIISKWVAVEYPADYYDKGGNNPSFLRDEQYAFFIRWVYNTGERSASFHIPGRAPIPTELSNVYGGDAFETFEGTQVPLWKVQNTANIDSVVPTTLPDGGKVIAKGNMGYWQSTERYPDTLPDIWGDLCGKYIRHHKMPDVTVDSSLNHFNNGGANIVVLGVKFENITHPVDMNGNKIESIIGYEILRGSREGQKTIIAKGMFNNMREYSLPNGSTTQPGLYQNYPYNDLRSDYLLTSDRNILEKGTANVNTSSPLTKYKKDVFSFNSPDTTFTKPFLGFNEVKIYTELSGTAYGTFSEPYKHPKFKVLTDFTNKFSSIIGTITSIGSVLGALAQDSNLSLQGTEELPYTKKLTLTKIPNFGVGGGGSVLGTGGNVIIPNPAIVGYNIAIGAFNALVAVAMSYIEAQAVGEQLINIVYGLVPKRQYALQYDSHAFYNNYRGINQDNRRRKVTKSGYIGNSIHSFDTKYSVNNLHRSGFIAVSLAKEIPTPSVQDDSRFRIGEKGGKINREVSSTVSSYYGALKVRLDSQYGQLDAIKQVIISECVHPVDLTAPRYTSDIIFGGDTYIGRYTEKNAFMLFNSWLMGEPDLMEIDYRNHVNVAYPRFWVNSERKTFSLFKNAANDRHLDERESAVFFVSKGYFYLFFNGVKDFFVESDINLAQRDGEDVPEKRHYDPYNYSDYQSLFRSDYIKKGNYYKYDYSLSIGKLFNNYGSWGQVYPRDYNPAVSEKCYMYRPNRVIYSLPQEQELKKDNWRLFLANNYKEFTSQVTAVKPINKTGALFMMKYQSPLQFMGVDTLQSDIGTKLTLGDGGLFNQPLQNLVNADESFEYGSCQGRFATIGTTHGVFWVSQNQGKIFNYSGGLNEISREGMKYWFAQYLPSELLKKYPDYPLADNPVRGIGVQLIYDNTSEILYICKKDYKPLKEDLAYDADGRFYRILGGVKTYFDFDSEVFEKASWTLSYDPKAKMFISFHDWIPDFLIPGKSHFMSVAYDMIWKHNQRWDSFCNFYTKDHPFEVEFISSTGQMVNSVRNVEYLLECYRYHNEGRDKYHVLDDNFDQAVIYNSEQVSGYLDLELKPKNNPNWLLNYPVISTEGIKIPYAKEEQKYRFNMFWDITKERGEFRLTDVPMWYTQANGYETRINTDYVDYSKDALERKKFRHNVNRVWLRKHASHDVKYLFKISNQKVLQSPR